MADPTFVNLPKDTWTKIITNETAGVIWKIESNANKHLYARKDTGGAAPTEISDGVPIFIGRVNEEFSAKAGSDVYIFPMGGDSRVMVDV